MILTRHANQHPDDTELDRLLTAHLGADADRLTPSSGFTSSVIDALRQQAAQQAFAPSPIPFPWKPVLSVAATLFCVLVLFVFHTSSRLTSFLNHAAAGTLILPAALLWTALALALSFAVTAFSFKLAGGRR